MNAATVAVPVASDISQIQRGLRLLAPCAGQVVELRALGVSTPSYRAPHVESGYFDSVLAASKEAARLSPYSTGVYITLNELNPVLLGRSINRMQPAKQGATTADSDVQHLRWLLIDLDPVRPSGISSSDEEHNQALALAETIRRYLVDELGWPDLTIADSGNGAHLLVPLDLPPEDRPLLKQLLDALAARFDTPTVKVDRATHNPARLTKVPGTLARKGDATRERPHRPARILHQPRTSTPTPRALLDALAAQAPAPLPRPADSALPPGTAAFDIESFIARHALDVGPGMPWEGGTKWKFRVCPFNAAHDKQSAVLIQHASGAVSFRCLHTSCMDHDWHALRRLYEPELLQFRAARQQSESAEMAALRARVTALESVEAENHQLRAENHQLRVQLEQAHGTIDRLTTQGEAGAFAELQRELAWERNKFEQIVDVYERKDMTHSARIATVIAKVLANAWRALPVFGTDPPRAEPQPISMGEVEQRAGIRAGSAAEALIPAAERGLLSRHVEKKEVTLADGTTATRTVVSIGPPIGPPRRAMEDLRRKAENDRKTAERAARLRKEAATQRRLTELEAALAVATARGCPSCGGDLLPTGYHCPACACEHTTETLAAMYQPSESETPTGTNPHGAPPGIRATYIYTNYPPDFESPIADSNADPPAAPLPGFRNPWSAQIVDAPPTRGHPPRDAWLHHADPSGF